jgi:hypothetical protein
MIPYEARGSTPKLNVYFFIALLSIGVSSGLANVFADYKVLPDYIEKWLSNSSPFLIYSLIFTLVNKFLWKIRLFNYPIGETLLGIPDISGEYRGYNEIFTRNEVDNSVQSEQAEAKVKITQTWTHIGVIYYGKDDTPISKATAVVLDSSNRDLIELDFLYQLFPERRGPDRKSQGMNHGVQISNIDLRNGKLKGTWFNGNKEQGYLNLTKEGT